MEGWKKNDPKEQTRAREVREPKPEHLGRIPVAEGLFFLGDGCQTKILNRGGLTYQVFKYTKSTFASQPASGRV